MKDFLNSTKKIFTNTNDEVFKRIYKMEAQDIAIALFFVFLTNYALTYLIYDSVDVLKPLALTAILIIATFVLWVSGLLWREHTNTISYWSKLYLLSTLSFAFNLIQIPLQIIGKYIIPDGFSATYYGIMYSLLILTSNFMLLKIISLGFRFDMRKTLLTFILFLSIVGVLIYFVQNQVGLIIPFFIVGK
ncbi:Uncharacterised protein [uncultured archaeon]|nr:Uncharacterised protein [uncultured archaeon]